MAWRLVFEVPGGVDLVFVVPPPGKTTKQKADGVVAVNQVIDAFRALVRDAITRGGCRSFTVGVHVEGPACDHEVSGG